ncbi:MAG: tripartite tricarboxylate transporter permease [Clostridia bacterium]
MEAIQNLAQGFNDILTVYNMVVVIIGSMLGTLIGALPGLGPSAGVALFLPLTIGMPVNSGLILLCGIYMGCMYGGRITAILVNIPGDAPAIVTAFDGYPLMKKGKGGLAMGISGITSFLGGTFGLIILIFGAPLVVSVAVNFGPPEYFMLMLFGLSTISLLADQHIYKALFMTFFGFLIGMMGNDYISGYVRFAFTMDMIEGIDFVAIVIGIFGIGEVLLSLENNIKLNLEKTSFKLSEFIPERKVWKSLLGPTVRGAAIGTGIGMLPGAGGSMATFLSYGVEKKLSKHPEEFGKGALEGMASAESSNNACVGGSLLTALTLGIPGSGTTAIMLGALIMFGMRPGPLLMTKSGPIIWAMIAGLIVANVVLLFCNIALIPFFVSIMRVIQKYLNPIIVVLCIFGGFSLNYDFFNCWVVLLFGLVGYGMKKYHYPAGPLILGIILSPLTEAYFRQSIMMSRGSYAIFVNRPVSCLLLISITIIACITIIKQMKINRKVKKSSPVELI